MSPWTVIGPPAVWAAHFLLSYATAAVWCAKLAGPEARLGPARAAIALYTAAALLALAFLARRAWARRELDFLAFLVVVLSGLSALAVSFAALPALFFESSR